MNFWKSGKNAADFWGHVDVCVFWHLYISKLDAVNNTKLWVWSLKRWCLDKIFLGILDLSKTFLGKLFFGRISNYGIFPGRSFLREIFLRRIFLGRIFFRGILPGKWLYQNPCTSAYVGSLNNFVFVFVFVFVYVFLIVIKSKGVVNKNIINFPQIYIWPLLKVLWR